MADTPYRCLCHNTIALVNARFKSYDSTGNLVDEVTVPSGDKRHLHLAQESGNTVLAEYYDVNYQHDGCYSVNNGDHIVIDGASTGFTVTVNGHGAPQIACPSS